MTTPAEILNVPNELRDALLEWYRETWASRTIAVLEDRADIEWIPEATRISWTEVVAKSRDLGIEWPNIVDFRRWWTAARAEYVIGRSRVERAARRAELRPRMPCGCPLDSDCNGYHTDGSIGGQRP